jgi:hypothetical protein
MRQIQNRQELAKIETFSSQLISSSLPEAVQGRNIVHGMLI